MNKKIELPKMRLPISTRGSQVHKKETDYDRKDEKQIVQSEIEMSE